MGVWIKPHRRKVRGKIRRVSSERKIVWVVKEGNIKKLMTTEKAEKYIKEHPGVTVYAVVKKYDLHSSPKDSSLEERR